MSVHARMATRRNTSSTHSTDGRKTEKSNERALTISRPALQKKARGGFMEAAQERRQFSQVQPAIGGIGKNKGLRSRQSPRDLRSRKSNENDVGKIAQRMPLKREKTIRESENERLERGKKSLV